MTKVYVVGGQEVDTLKEVASLLGVPRVTGKDIEAGKYPEVSILSLEDADLDLQYKEDFAKQEAREEEQAMLAELEEEEEEPIDAGHMSIYDDAYKNPSLKEIADASDKIEIIMVGDAPKTELLPPTDEAIELITKAHEEHKELTNKELTNEEDNVDEPTDSDSEDGTPEDDIEFPEVGTFKTEKDIKKYVKKLSDDQLREWCELEGATWNPSDHQSINRMRMAMAIKAVHFPDTAPKAGKSKKKSKYAAYSTEDLVQMAIDNDIEVRDDKGNERILRMYTIMALRDAGLLS